MKISVITATYNAMGYLPRLVKSLRAQVDKDFEWVVADGASTDGTVDYLRSINDINLKIISEPDFGIYDALNRAIKVSDGDFYLVLGADDELYDNGIKVYKEAVTDRQVSEFPDIVTAAIDYGPKISKPRGKMPWFYGQVAYVSGHAVGSLIRKCLHESFGYYSSRFPIAADQYFILKAIDGGAKVRYRDTIVGKHNTVGVSSFDALGAITEVCRAQVAAGSNKYIQVILCVLRLLKNIKKY